MTVFDSTTDERCEARNPKPTPLNEARNPAIHGVCSVRKPECTSAAISGNVGDVNIPSLARTLVGSLSGLFLLSTGALGCAPESASAFDEEADQAFPELSAARRVLLCQQGLSDRATGWDKGLFALCEAADGVGIELIRDGAHPAFGALDENGAYAALFDELDENGDGVVNSKDTQLVVHLVGFSWGGINTADIAERLRKDNRIVSGRRGVAAMVLLDAFQPQVSRVNIPSNVLHAWIYRQTETTKGDCSINASLGFGFNGHRPRARSEMSFCSHYDLDDFVANVGHCDVPKVATKAALTNLIKHADYAPWADHAEECPPE